MIDYNTYIEEEIFNEQQAKALAENIIGQLDRKYWYMNIDKNIIIIYKNIQKIIFIKVNKIVIKKGNNKL
jgi:hypothetical protein